MTKQVFSNVTLQFKRGTKAQWETKLSHIPQEGEMCIEVDTRRAKIGDGKTNYGDLQYWFGVSIEDIDKVIEALQLGDAAKRDVGVAVGNLIEVGTDGKIAESLIPEMDLFITSVHEASTQAEQDALVVQEGDVVIRTDILKSYIMNKVGSWVELPAPATDVLSVNGKIGAIVLTTDDIAEGVENLYYKKERVVAAFKEQSYKDLKDIEELVTTSSVLILDGGSITDLQ